MKPHHLRRQSALTLFEVTIAATLMGMLTLASIPSIRQAQAARQQSKTAQQTIINQKVANAILSYSEDASRRYQELQTDTSTFNILSPQSAGYCNIGNANSVAPAFCLPFPYFNYSKSSTPYAYAIANPTPTAAETSDPRNLAYHLIANGVPLSQINDDSSAAANVRVYQKLGNQQIAVPFLYNSFNANPLSPGTPNYPTYSSDFNPISSSYLILDYDVGAVYLSNCSRNSSACNGSRGQGTVPNDKNLSTFPSTTLKTINGDTQFTTLTWQPPPGAIGTTVFSTLPNELKRVEQLRSQISTITSAIQNYARSSQRSIHCAASTEATNPSSPFYRTSASPYGATTRSPFPKPNCINTSTFSGAATYPLPDLRYVTFPDYAQDLPLPDSIQPHANKPLTPAAITDPIAHDKVVGARYGCYDGWYPLTSWTSAIGLPSSISTTPWGGLIEYCADYSPAWFRANGNGSAPDDYYNVRPTKAIASAPHMAAIRFNRHTSLGRNPQRDFLSPVALYQNDSTYCYAILAGDACDAGDGALAPPHIIVPITP